MNRKINPDGRPQETETGKNHACANLGHQGRESGDQFHHSQDLFWFHENAKGWPSGFYCRKCLQDVLHVSPEGRTSLLRAAEII